MKMEVDFECHAKYIWEEVIERAYNEMLLKMTKEIEQIRMEGEAAIRDVSLSKDENERLEEVEEIIERISDQISEMSMRESITNDPIYDATLRNLIYESQIYQQEHENLLKNKEESIFMKKNLDILLKYLEELADFETFDAKMFREIVDRGLIYDDYKIEFIFKCGIKRKAFGWRRGKDPVEPLGLDTLEKIDS